MGYASRDLVNEADGAPKFSFDVKLAALTAMTAGESDFTADGVDYALDEDGRHPPMASSWVMSAALSSPPPIPASSLPATSRISWQEAINEDADKFDYTDAAATRPSMTSSTILLPRCGASSR